MAEPESEKSESASGSDPKDGIAHARKRRFSPFTRGLFEIILVVALALLIWQIANVVLLLFLSILLAITLRMSANALSARTPVPNAVALVIVGLAPFILIGGGIWLFEGHIVEQGDQMGQQFQETVEQIREHPWGQRIAEQMPGGEEILERSTGIFSQVTGAASRAFDIVAGILIVAFLSLYLAARPEMYQRGIIQLFPEEHRPRVQEALTISGRALWLWLLAQFVTMIVVGILVWVGLTILGVPLAPLLALLAGILEFVPIVGPIVASIPAILVGFVEGPVQALLVLALYTVVQQIESYVVMPIAQQHGTTLPPALTLLAAVIFGILFGPLGIVVATPLMVVVFTLTKLLYIEGVLGSKTSVPGRTS